MTLLLALKIGGALIASGAVAHKLITSDAAPPTTPPTRVSRLVKQMEWFFIVVGLLIAIISNIIESDNSQKANTRAQIQASNELQIMKITLNGVYRMVTRFDKMSFLVTYELPKSNYFVPTLEKRFASSPLRYMAIPNSAEKRKNQPNIYSANIVGYIETNNTTVTVSWSEGDTEFPLPDKAQYFANSNSENAQEIVKAIAFFCKPDLSLRIQSQKHSDEHLYIDGTNFMRSATLIYRPDSNKILIQWVFDCPKECWKQTKEMCSLPDLQNAILSHSVLAGVPEWLKDMKPISAKLVLDHNEIQIPEFHKYRALPSPPKELRMMAVRVRQIVPTDNAHETSILPLKSTEIASTNRSPQQPASTLISFDVEHTYYSNLPDELFDQ